MRPRVIIPVTLLALIGAILLALRPRARLGSELVDDLVRATNSVKVWTAEPRSIQSRIGSKLPGGTGFSDLQPSSSPIASVSSALPLFDLAKVPGSVRAILDPKADYIQRLEAIAPLRKQISEAEKVALFDFLSRWKPEDEFQKGHVLKNQIMDALCLQRPPLSDLADLLVQIYRDPDQNVVLRDYAVQHMIPLYESLDSNGSSEATATAQQSIRTALQQALSETGSSIAGTALIGQARLTAISGFDPESVGTTALKLIQDATVSALVQITSIQICARLQVRNALPILIEKARGNEIPIQLAAIAAVGDLGGRNEEEFLLRLGQPVHLRLKAAIEGAVARIRNRLVDGQGNSSAQSFPQGVQ